MWQRHKHNTSGRAGEGVVVEYPGEGTFRPKQNQESFWEEVTLLLARCRKRHSWERKWYKQNAGIADCTGVKGLGGSEQRHRLRSL